MKEGNASFANHKKDKHYMISLCEGPTVDKFTDTKWNVWPENKELVFNW